MLLSAFLLLLSFILALGQVAYKKEWKLIVFVDFFLRYLLLINIGLSSLMAAYTHLFMGPEIARLIGWQPGSPFQFEMGMANLSYGILGVLSYWIRGRFADATIIGWSILVLGCFLGHWMDYTQNGNTAPLNIGIYIWVYDLVLPLIALASLAYLRFSSRRIND